MPPTRRPWSCNGTTYLCQTFKRAPRYTGHTLQSRNGESSLGSWSALYIFVGILLTLFVATPFIAYVRKRKGDRVIQYKQVAKKATHEREAHKAEAASLLARQDQLKTEKNLSQTSKEAIELQLLEERCQSGFLRQEIQVLEQSKQREVDALEQTVRDVRTELTMSSGKQAEAVTDTQIARQECQSLTTRIQELENVMRTKEDNLKSLQQKFSHVNQEYRRQLFQNSGGGSSTLEE